MYIYHPDHGYQPTDLSPAEFAASSLPGKGWVAQDPPTSVTEAEAATRRAANIDRLWQAAHDYEYQWFSGSAVGLLTLGVLQNRLKALAVQTWVKSIWDLYYQRKALVTEAYLPPLDFSGCGPIPYPIPELMAELGM